MAKVAIRMKNKMLTKIHLDQSGNMVLSPVWAASDVASKGIMAQPAGPLTKEENKGLPGAPPSQSTSLAGQEPVSGASAERVAPETMPERDVQPAPQELERAPAQKDPVSKELETMAEMLDAPAPVEPAPTAPATSPNESLDTVTAKNVVV